MELTPEIIIYAVEEVFSSSILMSIDPGTPYHRTAPLDADSFTAVIFFSGSASGYAALHMSPRIAALVTQDLLYWEEETLEESIPDTLCELTNILAGRVKSYLDPAGSNLQLSLPELFQGNDFVPAAQPDATRLTVPFNLAEDNHFWVEVELLQ